MAIITGTHNIGCIALKRLAQALDYIEAFFSRWRDDVEGRGGGGQCVCIYNLIVLFINTAIVFFVASTFSH